MSFNINGIAEYFLGSNTSQEYWIFLGIFIGLFALLKLIDTFILTFIQHATRKTKIQIDDVIFDFFKSIKWPFYAYVSFYIATRFLAIPDTTDKFLGYLLVIFVVYYAAKGIIRIADHLLGAHLRKKKKDSEEQVQGESMIRVMGIIVKVVVWTVAFLMVLSNFGIEITPLIAGLGIGGIAIALALQNVLGDLFSAFAIYFDKPFKEGDFIIVGEDMGVVKFIGIKTTRIQALGGQEIVISNSELTGTRINNYKRMQRRRIAFKFGVEYSTKLSKLKKINEIVVKIINEIKNIDFDRCHFNEFGDSALMYEVVYYINSNDYNKYMDVQQEINFKIKEAFEKEKISMAFPTQTIHLKK